MISLGIFLIKCTVYICNVIYDLDAIDCVERALLGQVTPKGNRQISVDIIFPLKTNSLINLNPSSSNNF